MAKSIDGYENLKEAIDDISKQLSNVKYALYKSLGSKDLTLVVEDYNIDKLYKIIENINEIKNVNRAFSIFCTKEAPENIGNDNSEGLRIVSYLRLPKNDKKQKKQKYIEEIKNIIEEEGYKIEVKIYRVTGVMDLKLEFETFDLNLVFEIYKKIIPYITDYQTKIEKEEKLLISS